MEEPYFNLFLNRFVYEGLPMEATNLEMLLYFYGEVAFVAINGEYIVTPFTGKS